VIVLRFLPARERIVTEKEAIAHAVGPLADRGKAA
jgi:hypothetical protein